MRRKVSILRTFTFGFLEVLRVMFYFLWLFHSSTVTSLKVPAMIVDDVARKVLDTESFLRL